MSLNMACEGKVYPTTPPYQVGREKIREFATAIGDFNPAFHDVEAAVALGYPDVIAPPTFPFVLTIRAMAAAMFDQELGIDYARIVHGEQSFEFARPLHAGDEVVVKASLEKMFAAGRNEFVVCKADVETVDGEHVVTTRSVLVSRGTAPSDVDASTSEEAGR